MSLDEWDAAVEQMRQEGLKDPLTSDYDCLVYSTNSRNLKDQQSLHVPNGRKYENRLQESCRSKRELMAFQQK